MGLVQLMKTEETAVSFLSNELTKDLSVAG